MSGPVFDLFTKKQKISGSGIDQIVKNDDSFTGTIGETTREFNVNEGSISSKNGRLCIESFIGTSENASVFIIYTYTTTNNFIDFTNLDITLPIICGDINAICFAGLLPTNDQDITISLRGRIINNSIIWNTSSSIDFTKTKAMTLAFSFNRPTNGNICFGPLTSKSNNGVLNTCGY